MTSPFESFLADALKRLLEDASFDSSTEWIVDQVATELGVPGVGVAWPQDSQEGLYFATKASGGESWSYDLEDLISANPELATSHGIHVVPIWLESGAHETPQAVEGFLQERKVRGMTVFGMGSSSDLGCAFVVLDRTPEDLGHEVVDDLTTLLTAIWRSAHYQVLSRQNLVHTVRLRGALERARAANEAKSTFLANVSHEIRTPMTAIVGFSSLLMRADATPDQRRDWARHVSRNADYLLGLVNDTLDLSKAEAGEFELEVRDSSLREIMTHVRDLMAPRAIEKGLSFEIAEVGPVPDLMPTDPLRLRQVLLNLASNAVKYTPEGGVRIEYGMEPDVHTDVRVLKIVVIDTGIGISRENIGSLFEMFRQVHGDSSRFQGTGLGLALVRRFIHLLGGEVSVESELGVGTRMILRLDLPASYELTFGDEQQDMSYAPVAMAPVESMQGRHVLVVDDNATNRALFRLLLEDAGAHVTEAVDGVDGVETAMAECAAGRFIDLVVMDSQMPRMSGEDAIRSLREKDFEAVIIIVSANTGRFSGSSESEIGCQGFVGKPVCPETFVQELAAFLVDHPLACTEGVLAAQSEPEPPVEPEEDDGIESAQMRAIKKMADRLIASFPEWIADSSQYLEEGDWTGLKSHCHRLKGTAGSFGMPEISRLAGVCEALLKEEAPLAETKEALDLLQASLREAAG